MTRHLGMQVSAYVDGRLDASASHTFDQHLVVCLVCRYAADEERRLLASLRSGPTPGFSADLQSMLLALAEPAPALTSATRSATGRRGVPPIPTAPESVRQLRVPTVPPAGPALHRSPRRAAMVAGLAAGASAAAAIGLAFVGPAPSAAATIRAGEPRVPGTTTVTAGPAAFAGLSTPPLRQALGQSRR